MCCTTPAGCSPLCQSDSCTFGEPRFALRLVQTRSPYRSHRLQGIQPQSSTVNQANKKHSIIWKQSHSGPHNNDTHSYNSVHHSYITTMRSWKQLIVELFLSSVPLVARSLEKLTVQRRTQSREEHSSEKNRVQRRTGFREEQGSEKNTAQRREHSSEKSTDQIRTQFREEHSSEKSTVQMSSYCC